LEVSEGNYLFYRKKGPPFLLFWTSFTGRVWPVSPRKRRGRGERRTLVNIYLREGKSLSHGLGHSVLPEGGSRSIMPLPYMEAKEKREKDSPYLIAWGGKGKRRKKS